MRKSLTYFVQCEETWRGGAWDGMDGRSVQLDDLEDALILYNARVADPRYEMVSLSILVPGPENKGEGMHHVEMVWCSEERLGRIAKMKPEGEQGE